MKPWIRATDGLTVLFFPLRILDLLRATSPVAVRSLRHARGPLPQGCPGSLPVRSSRRRPEAGAGDDADHIVEEAVATDAQGDHISAPGQIQLIDRAHVVRHLFLFRAKAREIMRPDQTGRSLLLFRSKSQ